LTQKITISGAPEAELALLKLLLKSRANYEWFVDGSTLDGKQITSQISHLGIRQMLQKLEQVYRQEPQKFDKLLSLLIDQIDRPELLFDRSALEEFDVEKEQKFLVDVIRKIQQNFIKEQAKKLVRDMKQSNVGPNQSVDLEKLREISDLQKNRLSLKK
jgi:DNA primase